jgi:hypothetical protein
MTDHNRSRQNTARCNQQSIDISMLFPAKLCQITTDHSRSQQSKYINGIQEVSGSIPLISTTTHCKVFAGKSPKFVRIWDFFLTFQRLFGFHHRPRKMKRDYKKPGQKPGRGLFFCPFRAVSSRSGADYRRGRTRCAAVPLPPRSSIGQVFQRWKKIS